MRNILWEGTTGVDRQAEGDSEERGQTQDKKQAKDQSTVVQELYLTK